jgi:tetratricopeptide (TPR) repeat protein
MALFYLGSLLAYLRGREEAAPLWSRVISPGLFVLACFTKETALTLPLALLLCECIWWDQQKATHEALVRALRGLTVHALALAGMLLFLGTHGAYRRLFAISMETRSVSANLRSQVEGVGYLLSTWAWPAGLNIDPRLPVPPSWTGALVLKAGLLMAGLALGFWCLRRRPLLAFGVLWMYLHLLPTNSVVPRLDVVNERQIYLPAVGLSLLVAAGFGALGRHLSVTIPWKRAGTAALALGLALLTILRNRDYRSEVALWNRSVAVNTQNPRAWNNLGCAQFQAGHLDPAREAFQHALQLDPGYVRAQANLELTD